VAIVVTDTRILVEEKLIQPGQRYVVEGYGDLGANNQASLVCRYFNGAACSRRCSGTHRTTSWVAIAARSFHVASNDLGETHASN
jgi:hypothetical protein